MLGAMGGVGQGPLPLGRSDSVVPRADPGPAADILPALQSPSPRYLAPFDTFRLPQHMTDVLVVGTGVAGVHGRARRSGSRPSREDARQGRAGWLQHGSCPGGDCGCAPGGRDAPADHAADTIEVGCGLCDEALVHEVTEAAAKGVGHLLAAGADFDRGSDGALARGLEGGHSHPRILHARGDATGAEIRDVLARAVDDHRRIDLWSHAFLVDLLTDDGG